MIRKLPWTATASIAILLLCVTASLAHPRGQRPVLVLARNATGVDAQWIVAADDMIALGDSLALGPVTPSSFGQYASYRRYIVDRLRIEPSDGSCTGEVAGVAEVATGFATSVLYDCEGPPEEIQIRSSLLLDLSPEYIHHIEVGTPAGTRRGSLTDGSRVLRVSFAALAQPSPDEAEQDAAGRLEGLARGEGGLSLVIGIGLALVLGAVHGLTPGHGKTLTAAYLAGMHGTIRDATVLASVVAVAHGASTLALAGIASGIDKLAPERITPWLEGAMALLAAGVGIALLRGASLHRHHHDRLEGEGKLPLGQLVAIGLVGGLIPGPEAFAVGFLAVAHQQVVLGLILVAAFSLGLAVIVFGVAAIAVTAGKHLGTSHRAERLARSVGGLVFLAVAVFLAMRAVSG